MTVSRALPQPSVSMGAGSYFSEINRICSATSVRDLAGRMIDLEAGFDWLGDHVQALHDAGNSVFFIGNGGSASIASHQAIDYSRNGGIRARALNDSAALTCLANDYGYADVFSRQLDMHGSKGDLLVAISSGGKSKNILNGVDAARARNMSVVTFSGFRPDNILRTLGDLNFHVDSQHYGFVEIAHLTLIHAVLDIRIIAVRPE